MGHAQRAMAFERSIKVRVEILYGDAVHLYEMRCQPFERVWLIRAVRDH